MEGFWQAAAATALTVILVMALGAQGKQIGTLLIMAVCCILGVLALSYLEPVIGFIRRLSGMGHLDNGMLGILLKVVGIGLISEIAGLICTDSGNAALGKALQLVSAAVILRMSIPLLEQLLELLEQILGET